MLAASLLQALELDQAKNGSLIAIGVCIVLVLLVLKFISSLIMRLVLSVVFVGVGGVVYAQRASLVDCADKISSTGSEGAVTCTFFGRDVSINIVQPSVDISPEG